MYNAQEILAKAPAEYKEMHHMNEGHTLVQGCKLGTEFIFQGEVHIYVGVNGRNRKFPLIAYNVETKTYRKMTAPVFAKVRKNSGKEFS